ncbi:hypothetical protein BSKO_02297 [Bryopsis sp. KO-2023]|nr:hypothetical protein BSKO_02297 [Bryopsis sp. KO-2023]
MQSTPAVEGRTGSVATASKEPESPATTLPFNRIKKMMKHEGVRAVTGEASFVVARATELFLDEMASRSGKVMLSDNRRLLSYKDVAKTVQTWPALEFLKDFVPQKVKASVLIEQARQAMQREGRGNSGSDLPPRF